MGSAPQRLGIVTGPSSPDLTAEGEALSAELTDRGPSVEPVAWDTEPEWDRYDALLLRSSGGQQTQPRAFVRTLRSAADSGATVLNPLDAVEWNLHKIYLCDLADMGVRIVPTAFVQRGSDRALAEILDERGWERAVVKPAVESTDGPVWETSRADAAADQERFTETVAESDVLVQRYLPEVAAGETSLVFVGGSFSHAFERCPDGEKDGGEASENAATGDLSGGEASVESIEPDESVVRAAADVLDTARELMCVPEGAIPYARVDGVVRDGSFTLVELELVEPYLGLREGEAAEQLADTVLDALDRVESRDEHPRLPE